MSPTQQRLSQLHFVVTAIVKHNGKKARGGGRTKFVNTNSLPLHAHAVSLGLGATIDNSLDRPRRIGGQSRLLTLLEWQRLLVK